MNTERSPRVYEDKMETITEYTVRFADSPPSDGPEVNIPRATFRVALYAINFHYAILLAYGVYPGGLDAFKRSWDARLRLRRRGFNV